MKHTANMLASMADVASPDSPTSAGAKWLERIASYVDDEPEMSEDDIHEIADSLVPIYTHEIWSVFVDLAAYNEDIEDYGAAEDMSMQATVALYMIAERLLSALLTERSGNEA